MMGKINEEKISMYLVAIVAVVAAVGILVLLLNAGTLVTGNSDDLSGQAIGAKSMAKSMGAKSGTTAAYDPCGANGGHCCDPDCNAWCCN